MYNVLMRKTLVFLFAGLVVTGSVRAAELPGRAGDYADPEHPGVRVRVFVHEPRSSRPETLAETVTCTDSHVNDVVGPTGWRLPSNVSYNLNVASTPLDLVGVANSSFATWATPSGVIFNRGADTKKARNALDYQNIVAWGRTPGNALGVTYTRYYTATGIVADVDTIMNSRVKWSWNQCTTDTYDAQSILTHELGHWVGLDDEYTVSYVDNTMYGYGDRAETKKSTLEAGDVTGVRAIYK